MPDFIDGAYYTATWPNRPGDRSEPVVVYDARRLGWRYPGTGVRARLPEDATFSRLYRQSELDRAAVSIGTVTR